MASGEGEATRAIVIVKRPRNMFAFARPFGVYVNDRLVGGLNNGRLMQLSLAPGRHELFVRIDWWKSDVVALDLGPGESADLVCGPKALVTNKFCRGNQTKFFLLLLLAVVASAIPGLKRFVERHLAAEFLLIPALALVGLLVSFPKMLSRKPGQMLSLAERPRADADRVGP